MAGTAVTTDQEVDPATGLRKRIINSLDPNTLATDPTTPASPAPVSAAPFVSQWEPGASAPSNAPAGQHWDTSMANYTANAPAAPAPAGNDASSQIDALYKQYGIGDGGRGSGFADRAYWLEHPSEILNGRLAADLAGTGSDQPTGTPGTGPWSTSGASSRGAAAAPAAAPSGAAMPPTAVASGLSPSTQSDSFSQFQAQYQAQQAADAANKAAVRKILMDQLGKAGAPVNESDQNIAAPLSAARDEASRSTDAERTALAERLYAQGGGLQSNALTQGIQQSSERNAGQLSGLRASLISNEYNARRQQMTTLLSQALAAGDADSARQIQVQMAALDAALKREGLGVNLAEFGAQLNQNAALAGLNG